MTSRPARRTSTPQDPGPGRAAAAPVHQRRRRRGRLAARLRPGHRRREELVLPPLPVGPGPARRRRSSKARRGCRSRCSSEREASARQRAAPGPPADVWLAPRRGDRRAARRARHQRGAAAPEGRALPGPVDGSYEVVIAKTLAAIKLNMPVLTKAWNGLVDIFDFFKGIELPQLARRWKDDYEFARQAVQGISPVHIQSITALPEGLPAHGRRRCTACCRRAPRWRRRSRRSASSCSTSRSSTTCPMFRKVDKDGVEERRWAPASRCLLYLDDTQPAAAHRHPARPGPRAGSGVHAQ